MSTDPGGLDLGRTFLAHRAQLRGAAQRIVGTRDLADDVAQEAYLKLTQAGCRLCARQPVAYCFQVVRNLAIDTRRRLALESSLFAVDEGGGDWVATRATPERHAIDRQHLALIDQALDGLPARTREAFELHRLRGLTQRDIGRRLGLSAARINAMIREAGDALAHWRHLLAMD